MPAGTKQYGWQRGGMDTPVLLPRERGMLPQLASALFVPPAAVPSLAELSLPFLPVFGEKLHALRPSTRTCLETLGNSCKVWHASTATEKARGELVALDCRETSKPAPRLCWCCWPRCPCHLTFVLCARARCTNAEHPSGLAAKRPCLPGRRGAFQLWKPPSQPAWPAGQAIKKKEPGILTSIKCWSPLAAFCRTAAEPATMMRGPAVAQCL